MDWEPNIIKLENLMTIEVLILWTPINHQTQSLVSLNYISYYYKKLMNVKRVNLLQNASPINWLSIFSLSFSTVFLFSLFILPYQRNETGHCKWYDMNDPFRMKNWSQFIKWGMTYCRTFFLSGFKLILFLFLCDGKFHFHRVEN